MQLRNLSILALAFVSSVFSGCTGGTESTVQIGARCTGDTSFCLISCNLGCTLTGGCAVTEISQNQPLTLVFSQEVDASSVNPATISIKTITGESPIGSFLIDSNTIKFQPEVSLSGGLTTFGFRAGETYILTLPGGANQSLTLRSSSGDPLSTTVTCSLSVSQGLVDLDGQPPVGTMTMPVHGSTAPVDTTIVVEFSELIDMGPFQNGSTLTSPITYQIRKTRPVSGNPSEYECDPAFSPIPVEGVPRAGVDPVTQSTVVTLKPSIVLPPEVCIEVIVTDRVRDLSGRPAIPQTFYFFTEAGSIVPKKITESFATPGKLEIPVSSGSWNSGRAVPSALGGSGRLGSFDYRVGTQIPPTTYKFSTDSQHFPGSVTLFGQAIDVSDGVFEFLDFEVPDGIEVRFEGSNPAVIKVSGVCNILGKVTVNGQDVPRNYNGKALGIISYTPSTGQPKTDGGAGGGDGGRGGAGHVGTTGALPSHNGQHGDDLIVPAGSGYAGTVSNTGGRGSPIFPASGLNANVTFNYGTFPADYASQVTSGGGGGGFLTWGQQGTVTSTFSGVATDMGGPTSGGKSVPFVPLPANTSVLDHFLVGGSGGGGSGSDPIAIQSALLTNPTKSYPWHGGGAGGAGGGALAFRVGGALTVGPQGEIQAMGGDGDPNLGNNLLMSFGTFPPPPGGAGSGGSIVFQVGSGVFQQLGSINASGGAAGQHRTRGPLLTGTCQSRGGAGSHGYVRVEMDGIVQVDLGNVVLNGSNVGSLSSNNFSDLSEIETIAIQRSLWYSTRLVFPPTFTHYVLTCKIGGQTGQTVVYSDDPSNSNPADRPGQPVRIRFQGAVVNATTLIPDGEPGPWRDYISAQAGTSINSDGATGFRFMIDFDRSVETDIVIENLEIWYKG